MLFPVFFELLSLLVFESLGASIRDLESRNSMFDLLQELGTWKVTKNWILIFASPRYIMRSDFFWRFEDGGGANMGD